MSAAGGHGALRRHEEEHEEHENHERWLVSYADMMTLLMVLFIVMFAISQVDTRKFMELKTGLESGFGAPVTFAAGSDHLLDPGGSVAPDTVNLAAAAGSSKTVSAAKDATAANPVNPASVAQLVNATSKAQVAREVENLQRAKQKIQAALTHAGLQHSATFRFDERGLVVSIATDKVLFASGSATLEPEGQRILDAIAPTLDGLPNRISVDGHTNSIPINTPEFPSNWELSVARATGVLRYLIRVHHLPPDRLSATGFADTQPLIPLSDPRSTVANRRVEVVVIARVDDSAGREVAQLGNATGEPGTGPASSDAGGPANGPSPGGRAAGAVVGIDGIPNAAGLSTQH